MHYYPPYNVIVEKQGALHLKMSNIYIAMNVYTARLMPILLICLMGFVLFLDVENLPWWSYFGLIFIVLLSIYFMKMTFVTQIYIADKAISLKINHFLGAKNRRYAIADIDHISFNMHNQARGSSAIYNLILKDGTKINMATFPLHFKLNKEKFRAINADFKRLTGLRIEGDLALIEEVEKGLI